jgi:hypothetical protein
LRCNGCHDVTLVTLKTKHNPIEIHIHIPPLTPLETPSLYIYILF